MSTVRAKSFLGYWNYVFELRGHRIHCSQKCAKGSNEYSEEDNEELLELQTAISDLRLELRIKNDHIENLNKLKTTCYESALENEQQLKSDIDTLSNKLNFLEEMNNKLNKIQIKNNLTHTDQILKLDTKNNDLMECIKDQKDKMQVLEGKIKLLESANKNFKNENCELTESLENQNVIIKRLKRGSQILSDSVIEQENYRSELEERQKEIQVLNEQIAAHKLLLLEYNENVKFKDENINKLKSEFEDLQMDSKNLISTIRTLEADNKCLRNELQIFKVDCVDVDFLSSVNKKLERRLLTFKYSLSLSAIHFSVCGARKMANGKSLKCGICDKNITKSKPSLNCATCQRWFHPDCVGVHEGEIRRLQKDKISWKCGKCKHSEVRKSLTLSSSSLQNSGTRASVHGAGLPVTAPVAFGQLSFEQLTEGQPQPQNDDVKRILSELQEMRREFGKEIKVLQESLQFINNLFEAEKDKNKKMEECMGEIRAENQYLKTELEYVKGFVRREESLKIRDNIVITGICNDPREEIDHVKNKTMRVLKFLDDSVTNQDIVDVKLINPRENGALVQVKLCSVEKKIQLLKKRYQKGKLSGDICNIPNTKFIYVNEELTVSTYKLLRNAYQLKNYGYQFVWQRGGTVLAKINEGTNAIRIKSEEQVTEMISNATIFLSPMGKRKRSPADRSPGCSRNRSRSRHGHSPHKNRHFVSPSRSRSRISEGSRESKSRRSQGSYASYSYNGNRGRDSYVVKELELLKKRLDRYEGSTSARLSSTSRSSRSESTTRSRPRHSPRSPPVPLERETGEDQENLIDLANLQGSPRSPEALVLTEDVNLDDDILKALGEQKNVNKHGYEAHVVLKKRWEEILSGGFGKEEREALKEKYPILNNIPT
ncbi:unnamed protein product [Ceutorhynchus assimilis]|uniref:PHD-type domain-containing protein n=1 Tax=Ceutorhynchus assimilis TaxID=467358 RepID=A0A9N9MGN4_9CUCU|nr:unnamed protein product [Ceutorhynchus assimilis]